MTKLILGMMIFGSISAIASGRGTSITQVGSLISECGQNGCLSVQVLNVGLHTKFQSQFPNHPQRIDFQAQIKNACPENTELIDSSVNCTDLVKKVEITDYTNGANKGAALAKSCSALCAL